MKNQQSKHWVHLSSAGACAVIVVAACLGADSREPPMTIPRSIEVSPAQVNLTWADPTNALGCDDLFATFALINADDISDTLVLRDYDLSSIPQKSLVIGFEVEITWRATGVGTAEAEELRIQHVSGEYSSEDRGDGTAIPQPNAATTTFGGSHDNWGLSGFTIADLGDAPGGFPLMAVTLETIAVGGSVTTHVDCILLRIYYQPPLRRPHGSGHYPHFRS